MTIHSPFRDALLCGIAFGLIVFSTTGWSQDFYGLHNSSSSNAQNTAAAEAAALNAARKEAAQRQAAELQAAQQEAARIEAEKQARNTEARSFATKALKSSRGLLSGQSNLTDGSDARKVNTNRFLADDLAPNNNGLGGGPEEFQSAKQLSGTNKGISNGLLAQDLGLANDGPGNSPNKGSDKFLSSDLPQDGNGNVAGSIVNTPNSATKEQTDEFRRQDAEWRSLRSSPRTGSLDVPSRETTEGLLKVPSRDSTQPVLLPDGTTSTVGEETRKADAKWLETIKSPNAPK